MCIKYLVIFIDAHLNWKSQILHISKKIKRCVGILSKLRHYVNIDTLIMFYYSLIYFFLNYCTITWGNTYPTTLQPLTLLQKRAVRIITFSDFKAHTTPLFYHLKLLKLSDLIYFKNALFMYEYNKGTLPSAFSLFFLPLNSAHQYNTRLAEKKSFCLPKIRTNYGKFNIRFHGVKVWNSISDYLKDKPLSTFKRHLTESFLDNYSTQK